MANLSNINNKFLVTTGGNVLIGKTAANNATVGTQIMSTGDINPTVSGDTVARFNRLSNDGEIIRFQQDTLTDGAINSLSGRIAIGSGTTGIFFDSIRDVVTPHNMTTNAYSANISLGRSAIPFKDLYLSGQVNAVGASFIGAAASGAALVTIENNSGSTATSYGLLVKGGGDSNSGKIFEVKDSSGNTDLIIKGKGDVGIGTDNPDTKLHVSGSFNPDDALGYALIQNTSTGGSSLENAGINVKNHRGTSQFMQWEGNGLRIGSRILTNSGVGDVYFTAGADSVKMVIKAGGNVGIGTTLPSAKLDISGVGSAGVGVRIKGAQSVAGTYYYGYMFDGTDIQGTTQSNIFYAGGSVNAGTTIATWASIRIDTPALNTGASVTNNFGIYQSSTLQKNYFAGSVGIGTITPGAKLVVNDTTDGDKIRLEKSGALVGSVGTYNGVPYIGYQGGSGGGIMFNGASIEPTALGSSRTNNANDIGSSTYRWRNAYLGGGVFLGGTTAANRLDYYQDGIFTPTLRFGGGEVGLTYGGAPQSVYRAGHYTRIGRVVTFSLRIILTNKGTSTGQATIEGLPFDVASLPGNYGSAMYSFANNFAIPERASITMDSSSSIIRLRFTNSSGAYGDVTNSDFNNNSDIILTGTYLSSLPTP